MVVKNDDLSIYVTRGDAVRFTLPYVGKESYLFQPGDVVRFKVFAKKDAEKVVLQKDFPITEECAEVEIYLTKAETKIGEVISKPVVYWYEAELNPYDNPHTFIGYDTDGAKQFKLFPEGDDVPEEETKPEDIPVVDTELDMTSPRPVQNRVIAREIVRLNAFADKTDTLAQNTAKDLEVERARFDNLIAHNTTSLSKNLEYLDFITETTKAKIDGSITSDGVFATIKVNLREANLVYGGTTFDIFVIPNECRPVDVGVIHYEDGLTYRINYSNTDKHYYLTLMADDDDGVYPSGAGSVTITYALGDYELLDVRVGADGVTYGSAGTAVREQFRNMAADVDRLASAYMVKPDFCFDNKWINEAGEECADNNYAVTRIMDLAGCTAIKLRLYQYNNDDASRHLAMIAYYDRDMMFVSALTQIAEGNGIVETAVTPPEDARYAVASVYKSMENGYVKFYYSVESADAISKTIDLCDSETEYGYINASGAVVSDANWVCTDYIAVTPGETIDLAMHGHNIVNTVSYYDENKIFVSGVTADIEFLLGTTEKFAYGIKTVPEGVAYLRICWRVSDKTVSKCKYSTNTLAYRDGIKKNKDAIKYLTEQLSEVSMNTEKFMVGKTVFLAGDSRASTDYDFYGETMQKKTGANVIVGGASGWKTAAIATDAYFTRLTNNAHDFSLWLVGGNDTGERGTVGTFDATSENGVNGESVVTETDISADYNGTTFIQAVDHIMRKYKALFYDWKTLNNGHKPKMIFCTDIPQKRSGGETTWSLPANWERKRNAIIECCKKNNVACLDLYGLCNFDMDYEPEWTSPTDMVNNNGLYFMDGLHPNKYGIDIITSLEIEEIRKYLTIH